MATGAVYRPLHFAVPTLNAERQCIKDWVVGEWEAEASAPSYLGSDFLTLYHNRRRVHPREEKGGPLLAAIGHSKNLTTRFTRAITGHALIGRYRARFPHHGGETACSCGAPLETVEHIIGSCPKSSGLGCRRGPRGTTIHSCGS